MPWSSKNSQDVCDIWRSNFVISLNMDCLTWLTIPLLTRMISSSMMKRVCEAASFLRLLTRNAERTFLVKQLIHKIIVSLPPYMYCIKYTGQTFYTLRLVSLWFQYYRNLLLVITTQHLHCHLSIILVWYQTVTIRTIHCLAFLLKSLKVCIT